MNWKLLLLVVFLVPHCPCNAFARSKTRLLFEQLDEVLVKLAVDHTMMYSGKQACFHSLDVLKEDYRSEQYGIALLNNVFKRYHNLTQLVNFGCIKQSAGKISISEKDSTCEPFGCHQIKIRVQKSPKISARTEVNTDTNTNANTNTNNNTNTNSNANTNVNANHININVNFIQPPKKRKPKKPKTTTKTTTKKTPPPAKND